MRATLKSTGSPFGQRRGSTSRSYGNYHRLVFSSFARIFPADRPVASAFTLIGISFLASLALGLVVGLFAEDFRSAFGWTVAIGMIATAITLPLLVAARR